MDNAITPKKILKKNASNKNLTVKNPKINIEPRVKIKSSAGILSPIIGGAQTPKTPHHVRHKTEIEKIYLKIYSKGIERLQKAVWKWTYKEPLLAFKDQTRLIQAKNKLISLHFLRTIKERNKLSYYLKKWKIINNNLIRNETKNYHYINLLDVIMNKINKRFLLKKFLKWRDVSKSSFINKKRDKKESLRNIKRMLEYSMLTNNRLTLINNFNNWRNTTQKIRFENNHRTTKAISHIKMQNIKFNGKDVVKNLEDLANKQIRLNTARSLPVKYLHYKKRKMLHYLTSWRDIANKEAIKQIETKMRHSIMKIRVNREHKKKLLFAFYYWKMIIFSKIFNENKIKNVQKSMEKIKKYAASPFVKKMREKILYQSKLLKFQQMMINLLKKNDYKNFDSYYKKFKENTIKLFEKKLKEGILRNNINYLNLKKEKNDHIRLLEVFKQWKEIKDDLNNSEQTNFYNNVILYNLGSKLDQKNMLINKQKMQRCLLLWKIKKLNMENNDKNGNILFKNLNKIFNRNLKTNKNSLLNTFLKWKNKKNKLVNKDKKLTDMINLISDKIRNLKEDIVNTIDNYGINKTDFNNKKFNLTKNLFNIYNKLSNENLRHFFNTWYDNSYALKDIEDNINLENHLKGKIFKNRLNLITKTNNNLLKNNFLKWKDKKDAIIKKEIEDNFKEFEKKHERVKLIVINALRNYDSNNLSYFFNSWKTKTEKIIELEKFYNSQLKGINNLLNLRTKKSNNHYNNKLIQYFFKWKINVCGINTNELLKKYRNKILLKNYQNNLKDDKITLKNKVKKWKKKADFYKQRENNIFSIYKNNRLTNKITLRRALKQWKNCFDYFYKIKFTLIALHKLNQISSNSFLNKLRYIVEKKNINEIKKKNAKKIKLYLKKVANAIKQINLSKRNMKLKSLIDNRESKDNDRKLNVLKSLNKKVKNITMDENAKIIQKFVGKIDGKYKNNKLNLFTQRLFDIITKRIYTIDTPIINNAFNIKKLFKNIDKIRSKYFLNNLKKLAKKDSNLENINNNSAEIKKTLTNNNKKDLMKKIYKLFTYKILEKLFKCLNNLIKKYKVYHGDHFVTKLDENSYETKKYSYNNESDYTESKSPTLKFKYKSSVKNTKHLQMDPEEKDINKILCPHLIYYIQQLLNKSKQFAFNQLEFNYKSKLFTDYLTKFVNKEILDTKQELVDNMVFIRNDDDTNINNYVKIFKFLRKYYLYNIKKSLKKANKMHDLLYITNLVFLHKKILTDRYIRKIIKRWRFTKFIKTIAKAKIESIYKSLNLNFLYICNELFGNENINRPSLIKEFERFGNELGMLDNEDPELEKEKGLCTSYRKKYQFQPVFNSKKIDINSNEKEFENSKNEDN